MIMGRIKRIRFETGERAMLTTAGKLRLDICNKRTSVGRLDDCCSVINIYNFPANKWKDIANPGKLGMDTFYAG